MPIFSGNELPKSLKSYRGGALNFFSGSGVPPGFPKSGAYELIFASEKEGL